MRKLALILVLAASALLSACAVAPTAALGGASGAGRQELNVQRQVVAGTVQSVREVAIEGSGTVGMVGGGVLGAMLGSQIGGGMGKKLMTVAGAIGGGVLGNSVEKAHTAKQAIELVIRLDSGAMVSIVQAKEPGFEPKKGDMVRVLQSGNTARVIPV